MRILCVQHVAFEGPARIGEWAAARGHSLRTHFFADGPPPPMRGFDALVVMGGPMGVYETERHPWMREELDFVARAITEGRKTLGICLGAQVVAAALGARVFPQGHQGIGWFPVTAAPGRAGDPFHVFHWHGDTFELPAGATWLLRSEGCANQAFTVGDGVLALQCHLEVDEKALESWYPKLPAATGEYVQSEATMREEAPRHLPELGLRLFAWLDKFFGDAGA